MADDICVKVRVDFPKEEKQKLDDLLIDLNTVKKIAAREAVKIFLLGVVFGIMTVVFSAMAFGHHP